VYGGGTLINGIANAIPADSILSLGNSTSGGTYDLNGFDQTIDALATAGSSTNIVTNNGSGSGTNLLTLAGPDSGIFGGTIQDGSTAHIALTIAGATETLSGANTYTGATIVSSGTLIADNSSAFNTQGVTLGDANTTANNASPTLLTGGSVNVGNAITVANQSTSGTYTIGGGTDNLSTFSGTISINQPLTISQVATTALHALVISGGISSANGAQTVTFDNTGAVRVQTTAITDGTGSISVLQDGSGTTSFNVANSYSGTTTVSAGTLQAGATGAFNTQSVTLGDANTHTNNSSPALLTNGAVTIGNAITVANESTSGTYTVGGGTDNNSSFTGAISINQPLTVSQVATTGGHTLTVSGGVSSANGAQTLTFANAGNVSITTTALADGSGTLNVAQSGAGTTSFSIANPYSGTTDIYAGTLALIGSGSLGSGAVTLGVDGVSSGTLDLSGASGNVTLAQAVSGNGTFATGSNTLNVNASLSPGFGGSAGLVTVTGTGGVNFGSSSTLNFKINSATVSDQISLGAGSNLNFTSGSVIALATNYSPAPYTTITLVSLNGGSTITGITDFTGTTFSGGYWDTSVFGETGQIEAVPEPAAFGLLLGALALLAARRRRA
jgi:autotransporter-associated beta strand protein